jgi:hypothetical protein
MWNFSVIENDFLFIITDYQHTYSYNYFFLFCKIETLINRLFTYIYLFIRLCE